MTSRVEAKVNNQAGLLANGMAEFLLNEGINEAVVTVVDGFASQYPLAVRNTKNDGFWGNSPKESKRFANLAYQARLQADYAMTAPGRSAREQQAKLMANKRTATSYGTDFKSEMLPGYAVDPKTGLIVVATSEGVDSMRMAAYAERVIGDVENGHIPTLSEAGKWLHACFVMLESRLPADNSGIAMIALPELLQGFLENVVAAQASGKVVDPAKFSIVKAKVECVAAMGRPSGTLIDSREMYEHSNIMGAVPANFEKHGERILAVGGLDMRDDVVVIRGIAEGPLGESLGLVLLNEFSR